MLIAIFLFSDTGRWNNEQTRSKDVFKDLKQKPLYDLKIITNEKKNMEELFPKKFFWSLNIGTHSLHDDIIRTLCMWPDSVMPVSVEKYRIKLSNFQKKVATLNFRKFLMINLRILFF